MNNLTELFVLLNDVLQSAIVIFGTATVLYNVRLGLHNRIARAFSAMIAFVVIVYATELLVTFTSDRQAVDAWLRLEWLGIAFVPGAMFHLADALLAVTGDISWRRRWLERAIYTAGAFFLASALLTNWLVAEVIFIPRAPHLAPGPIFPLFTAFFWLVTAAGVYNVWRARQRCLVASTRHNMSYILGAFIAAPMGVYPYLLLSNNPELALPAWFWLILITGNVVVGILFSQLTIKLAYFGASSPDRVVRVQLYKYMARVPVTATLALTAMVLAGRAGDFLGLNQDTGMLVAAVATILVWGWIVHTFRRPFQAIFRLDDSPDVQRIIKLSERIVTTQELQNYLETVLATACDALRTPSAFLVSFLEDEPEVEVMVGPINADEIVPDDELWQLAVAEGNGQPITTLPTLPQQQGFLLWHGYWLKPLYAHNNHVLLGILGLRGRSATPDFTEHELVQLNQLTKQTALALEDRILQREVFAAVEDLLPQLTDLQRRRAAVSAGDTAILTDPEATPVNDPNFSDMVRDALSHYWGGPKLSESPLLQLNIVQRALQEQEGNPTLALQKILQQAIEMQRPTGERSMTRTEWLLYNILEMKFVQGRKVRDIARRLAMSESDLYRKQKVAIEGVAKAISELERATSEEDGE